MRAHDFFLSVLNCCLLLTTRAFSQTTTAPAQTKAARKPHSPCACSVATVNAVGITGTFTLAMWQMTQFLDHQIRIVG
jgi:hypothetical protein